MRTSALALALVAAWCAVAESNGRPPATSTITFQEGDPQHIVAGMTFGALFSTDGGQTWTWICEATFPYSGMYDPVFAYTQTGAVFATTFSGLKVMRDGCSFSLSPVAGRRCGGPTGQPCFSDVYISNVLEGSGSAIYATASSPYNSLIYKSSDDGQTFSELSSPGLPDDYWQSFVIAPSDPSRVYLAGYRFTKECDDNSSNEGSACNLNANCTASGSAMAKCTTVKVFLLMRSDDGGKTFAPLSQANVTLSQSSAIYVVGVDPTDANAVYLHVSFETGSGGDGVYKSMNGGGSGSADPTAWTKILDTNDPNGLVMLVRSNGGLVAGTIMSGAQSSPGGSACVDQTSCNWTALPNAPHINCLAEEPDNKDVWACTQNYGNGSTITSDGAGIMKTADLATWTPVLDYSDINAPVTCGSDTAQAQQCVAPYEGMPSVWCCLVNQLGITTTAIDCTGAYACLMGADDPAGSNTEQTTKSGCCNTGEGGAGALLLGVVTGLFLYRRRRYA